jgi:hypothetical protein
MNTHSKISTRTGIAAGIALALALASGTACAAMAQKTTTVAGSLIPVPALQAVTVRTPTMAMIRAIAIRPIVRPVTDGRCEIIGAVYSDDAAVADGPMPHVRTALIGGDGRRIEMRTNYEGVYHAIVPAGRWQEMRPDVGELPFGVHPSRPRIECR